MTNAMPLFSGTLARNTSRASSPPAEAPMPTMGKDSGLPPHPQRDGRFSAECGYFLFGGAGLAFFFMARSFYSVIAWLLMRGAFFTTKQSHGTSCHCEVRSSLWHVEIATPPKNKCGGSQ